MREIKFRAWDHDLKKMFYTEARDFYVGKAGACLYSAAWIQELCDGGFVQPTGHHRPKVVMQFTGLPDKNGKDIYEGDTVNIKSTYETDEPIDVNAHVLFRDGRFTTDFHDLQVCGFTRKGNWEGEVIGNIYENPEL